MTYKRDEEQYVYLYNKTLRQSTWNPLKTGRVMDYTEIILGHSRVPTWIPGNPGYLVPRGTRTRMEKRIWVRVFTKF